MLWLTEEMIDHLAEICESERFTAVCISDTTLPGWGKQEYPIHAVVEYLNRSGGGIVDPPIMLPPAKEDELLFPVPGWSGGDDDPGDWQDVAAIEKYTLKFKKFKGTGGAWQAMRGTLVARARGKDWCEEQFNRLKEAQQ